jgi:hypothetical protein
VLTLAGAVFSIAVPATGPADALDAGFVSQPLKLDVQHPYNLKLEERYSYDKATDTHDLWVLGTDKPHAPPPNKTTSRTEIRFEDTYKPDSGLHMMDCDMFITPGTHATISQIFGTSAMCMLVVKANGNIIDLFTDEIIAREMNGKWFHWTIIHDPAATGPGGIKVYVDGKLASDKITCRLQKSYYFKIGVYSRDDSIRSEIKIRHLRYLVKPPAATSN